MLKFENFKDKNTIILRNDKLDKIAVARFSEDFNHLSKEVQSELICNLFREYSPLDWKMIYSCFDSSLYKKEKNKEKNG